MILFFNYKIKRKKKGSDTGFMVEDYARNDTNDENQLNTIDLRTMQRNSEDDNELDSSE